MFNISCYINPINPQKVVCTLINSTPQLAVDLRYTLAAALTASSTSGKKTHSATTCNACRYFRGHNWRALSLRPAAQANKPRQRLISATCNISVSVYIEYNIYSVHIYSLC